MRLGKIRCIFLCKHDSDYRESLPNGLSSRLSIHNNALMNGYDGRDVNRP